MLWLLWSFRSNGDSSKRTTRTSDGRAGEDFQDRYHNNRSSQDNESSTRICGPVAQETCQELTTRAAPLNPASPLPEQQPREQLPSFQTEKALGYLQNAEND